MSPPTIGSEVEVRRTGKVTRYNNDNTLNVKLKEGRGRPHKVHFADVLHPHATPAQEAPSGTSALTPLAPLPALPPLEIQEAKPKRGGHLLGIGTIVTVLGMVGAGIFHGMGVQLWNALWGALSGIQGIGH